MPKKLKRGAFGIFQHPFCRKTGKNENKNIYFRGKISLCRKKLKGGPFGIFQHPFCCKTSEKMQGDPLGKTFFRKKSRSSKKNERGTLWSRPVWYVTRKNFFGSVR